MSVQFSRSMRSVAVDGFRPSLIGLILAILTLLALIAWFFLAKVTIYESSVKVSSSNGKVYATFSSEGMRRINQGQLGVLRINTPQEKQPITIPIFVFDTQSGENTVEINSDSEDLSQLSLGEDQARVDVEVEYITPAQLVMRASGKFLNRTRLPVSPQESSSGNLQWS